MFVLPDFEAFNTEAKEREAGYFTIIAAPTDFKYHGRLMSRCQVPKPKGGAASLPGRPTSHWPVPVGWLLLCWFTKPCLTRTLLN